MFHKKRTLKSHLYKANYILMTWTDVVTLAEDRDRQRCVILYINKPNICTHARYHY